MRTESLLNPILEYFQKKYVMVLQHTYFENKYVIAAGGYLFCKQQTKSKRYLFPK